MTLDEIADIIQAAKDGKSLQRKDRWFPTIQLLAEPHVPEGESIVEWRDMGEPLIDSEDYFNFADCQFRVKP
jgi:hypothetical protein